MASSLKAVAWEHRIALAPAHLMMRARDYADAKFLSLMSALPDEAHRAAASMISAIDRKTAIQGRFPQEFMCKLGMVNRFICV